ncbi:hypothetical protein BASA83_012992 [Batrachochytrium salamandrivorans]|nr:hypothetical protein BASA83_012992 [Batrachochytrium salamandrivorans]
MFEYAAKTAWGYQGLYKDPDTSPFYLELLPSTPDEPKQKYKWLQDNVPRHIQRHISAIEAAIEHITYRPKHVIYWLDQLMTQTGDFYKDILELKNVYPRWLKQLGISDNVYLKGLEMHTKDVEEYKNNLSDRFNKIKKMVEDYRKNSNQRSSSKASSSSLESKKHPEVESKPSENGASSSAQSKGGASSSSQSKGGASSSSQSKDEASSSAQSKGGASSSSQSKGGASSIAQSNSEASSIAQSEDGVVYDLVDFSDDE